MAVRERGHDSESGSDAQLLDGNTASTSRGTSLTVRLMLAGAGGCALFFGCGLLYVLNDDHFDPEFSHAPRSLAYTMCRDGTPGNSCNLCKDPSTPGCGGKVSRSCACTGGSFGAGGVEEAAMHEQVPKGCNIQCQRAESIFNCMLNIGDRQANKKPMSNGNSDLFTCTAQGANTLADQALAPIATMMKPKKGSKAPADAAAMGTQNSPLSWMFPPKKQAAAGGR
eukprot:TRINITY_DN29119_c0_g1_i1.p1 TRINITY_DN29119_c0_g1~~TRINITY_DN29119_c0_g1_i1.p1  ORF type:complete len:225 (+),score=62.06 TRINITY_DN29119_c0_g1_i1:80-754(+)